MSQAPDWNVPTVGPASPTEMAGRMSASFNALLSQNAGSGRPDYAIAGMTWVDTSTAGKMSVKLFDGTTDRLLYTVDLATGKISLPDGMIVPNPSLVLKQSSSPSPTDEGEVQWDTDDDYLVIGKSGGQKVIKPNAWELISVDQVTNVAAWVKTGLDAYKHLRLTFNVVAGNTALSFQASSDNGAPYLSSVYYYLYQYGTSGGPGADAYSGMSTFPICTGNVGSPGGPQLATVLITDFNKPRNSGLISDCFIPVGSSPVSAKVGGGIAAATAMNAMRIFGSANFDGDFILEGIKG